VQQEATNELVRWNGARALAAGAKGDQIVLDGEQARVGDGHAMGVEAEVVDNLLWAAEGLFGIDDPVLPGEAAGELAKRRGIELGIFEGACLEELDKPIKELPAEDLRERRDGEEEVLAGTDPAVGLAVETAAGNNAVNVGVEQELTGPGVQDEGEADLGTEALGVAAEGEQGVGGGREEQVEEHAAVAVDERSQQRWQSEDEMEVVGQKEALFALLDPVELRGCLTSGAVTIEAGVVEGHLGGALLTLVEVATEDQGAAAFDIVENALLLRAEVVVVVSKALGVGAEDGGDLQRWCGWRMRVHARPALRTRLVLWVVGVVCDRGCDGIERGAGGGNQLGADVDVTGSGADVGMTEQDLDDAQIGA